MRNSYILQENLLTRYASEFNQYAIRTIYGDIILGSDIEAQYKDDSLEDNK